MGKTQLFTNSQTDGVPFPPVSPVLNGRCLIRSPTIILPLIQCLALLQWLPIGSCFGGMHWLHLPAGRIPAFLNKALILSLLCCWPGCPAPPLHHWCLDTKHKLYWGATAYLMWQQHHTATARHDTADRGNDGTAQQLNPLKEITGNKQEIGIGWSHVVEILLSDPSEVILSGGKLDMKRECLSKSNTRNSNPAETSRFFFQRAQSVLWCNS